MMPSPARELECDRCRVQPGWQVPPRRMFRRRDRVQAILDAAIDMWQWEYDSSRAQSTIVVSISDKRRPPRAP